MNLLYIHGAPATGKLTVAKAIAARVPARVLDNHIFIDYAKSVLEFGAPRFFELVRESRALALRYAAESDDAPLVIFTSCYSEPEDRAPVDEIESVAKESGGRLFPVFLFCAEAAQYSRVVDAERAARGKINSIEGLKDFSAKWNFAPISAPNCYKLDTTDLPPDEAAQIILRQFRLSAQHKQRAVL
jgi:hypothetical protein